MKEPIDIMRALESITGFRAVDVERIVKNYRNKYKKFYIPKRSGGNRAILHPARPLKLLQHAVDISIIQKLPVSKIARAYIKGLKSPLRTIANEHIDYRFTVRIDFKDFFPSLRPADLYNVIINNYTISAEDFIILEKILFIRSHAGECLPIGAPSSPNVSNAIMYEIDNDFMSICSDIDRGASLSRYADDLYFSTNHRGRCQEFYRKIIELCHSKENPSLKVNTDKLAFLSRGTRRIVCGIVMASQGFPSIGRERKNTIKKLLYKMTKNRLDNEEKLILRGMMAFTKDAEPEYYNKLIIKYGVIA